MDSLRLELTLQVGVHVHGGITSSSPVQIACSSPSRYRLSRFDRMHTRANNRHDMHNDGIVVVQITCNGPSRFPILGIDRTQFPNTRHNSLDTRGGVASSSPAQLVCIRPSRFRISGSIERRNTRARKRHNILCTCDCITVSSSNNCCTM